MRIGICLPQMGQFATAEGMATVARRAEELGYNSIWVADRLLYPLKPRNPYRGSPDGSFLEIFKCVLDPIESLTFAAAHTKHIALGISVLVMPFYNPVVLARRLASLDVLSGGRLRAGFGQGFSEDEFEAAGANSKIRGQRADEFLQVIKAVWTESPVSFSGKFFQIAPSLIELKPIQKPHPPIYLAASAPSALRRLVRLADGWNPSGITMEGLVQTLQELRKLAEAEGRDPSSIEVISRANLLITDQPLVGNDRKLFRGTLDQIRDDFRACQNLGVSEVFFDANFFVVNKSLQELLTRMEQLRDLNAVVFES